MLGIVIVGLLCHLHALVDVVDDGLGLQQSLELFIEALVSLGQVEFARPVGHVLQIDEVAVRHGVGAGRQPLERLDQKVIPARQAGRGRRSGRQQFEPHRFAIGRRRAHPQVEQAGLGGEHAFAVGEGQLPAVEPEHHVPGLAGRQRDLLLTIPE